MSARPPAYIPCSCGQLIVLASLKSFTLWNFQKHLFTEKTEKKTQRQAAWPTAVYEPGRNLFWHVSGAAKPTLKLWHTPCEPESHKSIYPNTKKFSKQNSTWKWSWKIFPPSISGTTRKVFLQNMDMEMWMITLKILLFCAFFPYKHTARPV